MSCYGKWDTVSNQIGRKTRVEIIRIEKRNSKYRRTRYRFFKEGEPVISVDTKKKELVENFQE
jgi:hypothetical protein